MTKPIKYPTTRVPVLLYNLGISYHATGILHDENGCKLFDFYKSDKITPEQEELLNQTAKGFRVMYAGSQYAPEQRKPILCFPKSAYWRLNP